MGIAFVLVLYAVGLSVAAAVASGVLWLLTRLLLPNAGRGRKRACLLALLLPPVSVVCLGCWFVGYWVVNAEVFRDPGLGDTWSTPMPNGYMLTAIDVTDYGSIYDSKLDHDGMMSNGAVMGVRRMQVDENIIAGTYDSEVFERPGDRGAVENHFFLLDTRGGKKTEFASLAALDDALRARGLHEHLKTFWQVFLDYRNTWFDDAAGIVAIVPPLAGFGVLVLYVVRMRRPQRIETAS